MSVGLTKEDVDAVRAYVTAKDGHEYDYVDSGIVCFDITHNYLKVKMHSIRMPITSTILELKQKIVLHTGTPVEYQKLELQSNTGIKILDLSDNTKTLESYNIKNGMIVHCVDFNPNSLAKDGGLDDTSKVQKYVMSDEDYNKRPNTYRAYKLQTEDQRISEHHNAETEFLLDSIQSIHKGDRCEVSPGSRRGTVMWTGILEEHNVAKGGYWVGVKLDEPTGRNDGCYKGKRLFDCAPNYGVFVRGTNVTVGDFPEEDLDLDLDLDLDEEF